MASKRVLAVVDQVHLVDGDDEVLDAAAASMRNAVAPRLREHAVARVDQDDRQVAVEAPVTMLRVYCSWPGVSAMMNLRFGRRSSGRRRRW
jgi:hypothetical protein